MEQNVVFEEKVYLIPKDMNRIKKESVDDILLRNLREKLEGKCSQHGFVVPRSLTMLSRSMGLIENGRFTGSIVFHCQAQGKVYNPANGTRITGVVLKRNKMGLYVIYRDAIRILVPRDLHLGSTEFEEIQVGDTIEIEIRKSRFQIQDPFILSVGVFISRSNVAAPQPIQTEEEANEETENEPVAEETEVPEAENLLGNVKPITA